jgi:hypothetical protein
MLEFDDPRWEEMTGGYKVPFDPRPLLQRLESEKDIGPVWSELWQELYHQGDVGEASFAAIPHIVRIYCERGVLDYNAYAMIAIIELARNRDQNPDVPQWLKDDCFDAIHALAEKGGLELPDAQDTDTCCAILGILALDKGLRTHARLLANYSEDELRQMDLGEAN